MSTRGKLTALVIAAFVLILTAINVPALPIWWRGIMMITGGWFLAVGSLYQVQLYAVEKDVSYYVLIVVAGVICLAMIALTLFYIGILTGLV